MPNFVSFAASIAELAHGEKLRTHQLTQSPSLFDAPGTEAFALENTKTEQNDAEIGQNENTEIHYR